MWWPSKLVGCLVSQGGRARHLSAVTLVDARGKR
jgi:hypothetical protein